jgi:hypothetical protein
MCAGDAGRDSCYGKKNERNKQTNIAKGLNPPPSSPQINQSIYYIANTKLCSVPFTFFTMTTGDSGSPLILVGNTIEEDVQVGLVS